jgi:uncharacterized protein (TIGR03083 family)
MAASAASTAGVALLERAVGYTLGNLRLVTAQTLASPTPCREWDLRALLGHLADSMLALISAVQPARVPVIGDGEEVVSVVRGLAGHLIGVWSGAPDRPIVALDGSVLGGPPAGGAPDPGGLPDGTGVLTRGIVSGTGAIEVAVHGWDIARACGARRPIPAALADEMLDLAVLLVTEAERPALFGPPVRVSSHAEMSDRLVAFLGRDPF